MKSAGVDKLLAFFFGARGRISRIEYGLGAGMIVAINAAMLMLLVTHADLATGFLFLIFVLGIPLTVALFVVTVKRCHDIGLSGSFSLLLVLPFIGPFWLILLAIIPGKSGPNAYGPMPTFQSD